VIGKGQSCVVAVKLPGGTRVTHEYGGADTVSEVLRHLRDAHGDATIPLSAKLFVGAPRRELANHAEVNIAVIPSSIFPQPVLHDIPAVSDVLSPAWCISIQH
jgi:hypothetical protein